jgi:hypothetical protein
MFALIQDGQVARYPYSVAQFRAEFRNVSLPAQPTQVQLEEVGLFAVSQTGKPAVPFTQVAEDSCQLVDGQWTQVWTTRAATAEEAETGQQLLVQSIVDATQARLDAFARTRNYDGILSLCTYATSAVLKFRTEGQYGVDARDNTWATLYQMLAEVEAGTRPIPTGFADVEGELPVLEWPV